MKKFLLGVLLAIIAFPLTGSNSHAASFQDVGASHRAKEEIYYLAEGKIASGDLSGFFMPDKEVTRGEAVAMIGRALNLNGEKRATQFSDVGSQYFASGYIQSAVSANVISGYGNGVFKPDSLMTRGEMAVLISKAFDYEFGGALSGAANALISRGISQGLPDGTFGTQLQIKRADFSVFLARAINYKLRTLPDVEFEGAYFVNADTLNVRTGPSTNYAKVAALPKGSEVQAAYSVGDWLYIRSNGVEGLVHGAYLGGTFKPGDSNDLSKQMIVIDPGHGGHDPGAIGFGILEKEVALSTALKLKSILTKSPFQFKLTRETDVYLSLEKRVEIAKQADADMFISIHSNAFNGKANGTETYYYNSAYENPNAQDSKLLATKIQNRLLVAWNLYNRGVKHGNFHVIRENSMPAVLVELGFIDNQADNEKLKSDAWRQKAAEAIYLGILDYYKDKGFNVTSLYNNI
ncbi:N-acetylmuramoyl-L-alanine amidase [Cytobacillus spongiae]|uniref:N-acetylmuramoyl-L-alanine amidase n=1 Tax=Cytobacillus spongiae TaxID=2901381 RepID=UPI001F2356D5|nr:N-acetylmuramoyl-L-alanine amidase [Cytobacillus spongiae]UII55694.1 N-acetylmuramoyl-L-alanine amidase [Cytobacillus spongiae]